MPHTRGMKLHNILAARAAHKELERELATYTSASDRDDLDAILARHDEEQSAGIRRIVATQRASMMASSGTNVPSPRRG
jgi:hypothetical protein